MTRCGEYEEVKAAVHAVIAAGAGTSCVYSVWAFAERPKPAWHLFVNAALYAVVTAWECRQVAHHWQAREAARRAAFLDAANVAFAKDRAR